jgi:hypothetical protein
LDSKLEASDFSEEPVKLETNVGGVLVVARAAPAINHPVYFVDVGPARQPVFQCVAKRHSAALAAYEQLRTPVQVHLRASLPQLLAPELPWLVMERVEGDGGDKLGDRIGSDEVYARSWGTLVGAFVGTSAKAGIQIPDVEFVVGHNCIREAMTGSVRLVELDSLVVSPWPVGELAGQILMAELDTCSGKLEPRFARCPEYAFELTRAVIKRVPAGDLLARGKYDVSIVNGRRHVQRVASRRPSNLLCQTVKRGHFDAFKAVLADNRHAEVLQDPAVRRSWLHHEELGVPDDALVPPDFGL